MSCKLLVLACLLAIANARHINNVKFNASTLVGRIIGGHNAKPGQFPHQISLQFSWPEQGIPDTHFCGGSILNKQWILTAAHCLVTIEEAFSGIKFVVKAGKHDLSKIEDTEQVSPVDKFFIHEKYQRKTVHKVSPYDIGLIQLKKPLGLNKRVVPISFPKKHSEPTGDVTLSGWGSINSDSKHPEMPDILQTVDLHIINRASCNKSVHQLYENQGIPLLYDVVDETNICSGPTTGGVSACGGDSGGPLISKGDNGKPILVGVVSWGINPCGFTGAPSVYAKASIFVDWIHKIISKN